MHLLDKIMILQGVRPTIQPLGAGYASRPKMGGGGPVFSQKKKTGLDSLDLTTSASKTSIFELPRVENFISRLCTNSLGDIRSQYPNKVKKT